jgi:hypothetical protein
LALGAIAARLGVAKSSVSRWVRDIELTPEQAANLAALDPTRNGRLLGMQRSVERRRSERRAAQEHGRALARIGAPLHREGCMLHWAEGSKRRNAAELVNADPDLLRTFVDMLRECYGIASEQFTFSVNCFLGNGLTLEEIEEWWLERLDIPRSCVRTGAVKPRLVRLQASSPQGPPARHRPRRGALDVRGAEHLRGDPGVPRHRPPGVAGSVRWAVWDSNPEPRD